ncbi:hypothetical protein MPNT_300013 [Candidatus Methylacidithermus pantelleriae]|uniref:Uncharacterized protein n=1 Tax=Candidatus Methylacidithermus pantelleriae TaxID=2744239 RepID=A0A8J2FP24_9BACT|nr:hypothetical protein MPNT_300013 [Candidatus Methylacidithermus pantelleriae]
MVDTFRCEKVHCLGEVAEMVSLAFIPLNKRFDAAPHVRICRRVVRQKTRADDFREVCIVDMFDRRQPDAMHFGNFLWKPPRQQIIKSVLDGPGKTLPPALPGAHCRQPGGL